jgi:hypothetical protein
MFVKKSEIFRLINFPDGDRRFLRASSQMEQVHEAVSQFQDETAAKNS